MSLQGQQSKTWFQRAKKVIPFGVNSNFRYWGDDDTLIITRGKGAHIWDADGKRYIDYRLAFGPIILGHADERVNARVAEVIENGTLFALTTPLEVQVAERVARLTGVDKVRLANTGTEATMHALRIARAHTGREKFIKFEGQYHGMHDYVLFSTASTPIEQAGPPHAPRNVAMSKGIPKHITQYVINLPYNDLEVLEETVEKHAHELAAIFLEPVMGNVAGIMPRPGFLQKMRSLCDRYGIVLVFDEVKTGFRLAPGGAQQYFGIQADLVTYAKAMGNGFPVAAIGGKEEFMMTIEPGVVSHGGTYTANAVGVAAADATLAIIETEPVHKTIEARGRALMDGISEILARHSIPHAMTGHPSMFAYILGTDTPPLNLRDYNQGNADLYEKISLRLIQNGVFPETDGREPWFLCAALSEADVAETLTKFETAVRSSLEHK